MWLLAVTGFAVAGYYIFIWIYEAFQVVYYLLLLLVTNCYIYTIRLTNIRPLYYCSITITLL